MNYQNQSPLTQAQMSYQPVSPLSNAGSIFHPGFAGTNVQEVRQLNSGYAAPATGFTSTYGTGISSNIGYGTPVQTIFQPGFAGTNVQEVRQLNSGGYMSQPMPSMYNTGMATTAYPGTAQSIFHPGFAGTDAQEVRARNAGNYFGQQGQALQSGYAPLQPSYGINQAYVPVQSYVPQSIGTQAQSIFQQGFAGTNPAEVRHDYALAQNTQPQPQQYPPFRGF